MWLDLLAGLLVVVVLFAVAIAEIVARVRRRRKLQPQPWRDMVEEHRRHADEMR